ncbi:MAG: hypothetical protein M4D80_11830 [Myxococcota bacterium]|nr:hypothetical protein [Deltaproteobacteria bacterium]MDQ3335848.1 hypothetical protein [Myxococcota bacterium]
MRTMVVVAVLMWAGCKEKDKDAAREIAQNVKERSIVAKDKVVEVTGDLYDKAVEKGKAAKVELDKAYKSDSEYDLAIDDVDSAEAAAHAAKMDKLPSVDVKGVRVAYEEDSNLSLRGTTYKKHFRASWKRNDKIIRVSFFTKETIDAVAFAQLLAKIVPAVEFVVK